MHHRRRSHLTDSGDDSDVGVGAAADHESLGTVGHCVTEAIP